MLIFKEFELVQEENCEGRGAFHSRYYASVCVGSENGRKRKGDSDIFILNFHKESATHRLDKVLAKAIVDKERRQSKKMS